MFPCDNVIMRFTQQRTSHGRRFDDFVSLNKISKNTVESLVIWDAVTLLSLQWFISWSRYNIKYRADSRFAPSHWETSLQSNAVSHWLRMSPEIAPESLQPQRKVIIWKRFPHRPFSLHWRNNDHGGVSNHQPHDCLLDLLFRRRSKKTSKLRVTGLCAGNSPGPVNSPHKWPVTRKMFLFDDVIMLRIIPPTPGDSPNKGPVMRDSVVLVSLNKI